MNVYRSLGVGMLGWDWPRLGIRNIGQRTVLVFGAGQRRYSFIDIFKGEHTIQPSQNCRSKGFTSVRPQSAYYEP